MRFLDARSVMSKRCGQQPSILDVWTKRSREELKESEDPVNELESMDTASTSTEHVQLTHETQVGELASDCCESCSEKDAEDIPTCGNICCSCEGEAYQPKNDVILASLTNKGRKFLPVWYERFPWITICATRKKVFCVHCRQARSLKCFHFPRKAMMRLQPRGLTFLKRP